MAFSMHGRPTKMAGRRLPIRRSLAVAIALSAACAVPAVAQEWVAVPTPGASQGDSETWQINPDSSASSAGTWRVSPGADASTVTAQATPATTSGPADPSNILSNFAAVAQANTAQTAPPAPPTAVDVADTATPEVRLDADHPALVALRAAEDELNAVSGELAEVRAKIEQAGAGAAEDLQARATALEAKQQKLQAKVDALQKKVDAALAAKRKKAEEEAARAAAASTGFPTVSGTVPTIDANLSGRLDSYLASKGSPLAGLGNAFVYYGSQTGVDPRFLVAISGAETSFGTYGPSQTIHNPFGMGPGIVYPTWQDAIAGAARNLGGSLYKGSNLLTIAQIQKRWAPNGAANDPTNLNSHWYTNVSRYYTELGGDPNGSVFIGTAAQATAIPVAPGVAPGIQGTVAAPTAYGVAVPVQGGGRGSGPAAVKLAQTFLGVPYVWGGTSPSGFDCSGLVQYVYAKQGVKLPRVAEDQAKVGTPIAPEQLQPGDAVFFADRTGYIHHEGMYVGGGYFIHAPRTGDVVKISSLYEPYYATQYAGARRY